MAAMWTRIWWVRPVSSDTRSKEAGGAARDAPVHFVVGAGRAPPPGDGHAGRRPRRAADRGVDHPPGGIDDAVDEGAIAPTHLPFGQLVDEPVVTALRVRATTSSPEVPRSRRCTIPGRSASAPACSGQRRRGRGTGPGARAPACLARLTGTRVHHEAGRLVPRPRWHRRRRRPRR